VSQLKDEHKVKRMNLNVDVSLHHAFKAPRPPKART
jgi:hypothetical protein